MLEKCQHPQSEIRWRTQSNGARQAWRQCLICYQVVGQALKHADVPKDAPDFDEQAREDHWKHVSEAWNQHWQQEQARRQAEYDAKCENRRQEYLDYLDTIEWRQKREAVLARDRYVCQAKLPGCIGRASQAHHLTYKHIFNEPLFELVAVCRACHEQLHQDDER
jgi:hypothetical protein